MSGKRTKHLKPTYLKRIPGDHRLRFFLDIKSSHPFMCISIYKNTYYGHQMTTHPSLYSDGTVKRGYMRFKKNPNKKDKRFAYYEISIRRIVNTISDNGYRLKRRYTWVICKKDLKTLKQIDKKIIKNVRRAINKK